MGDRICALEQRLALLEGVLDALPDPVFVKDQEHRFVYVNDACARFVRHQREALLGRDDTHFFPAEQVEVFWARDDHVLQTGELHEQLEDLLDGQGRTHVISTRKARGRAPDGAPLLVGTIRDVSEAVARMDRKERVIDAVRILLARVSQEAGIGIGLFGDDGCFLHASGPDLAQMGITTERVLGVHYTGLAPLWPELVDPVADALAGQRFAAVLEWRGRLRHVTVAPVIDSGGRVVGASIFSVDLTELQQRERRVARDERMDSLARLAGGVAHDLNNLLAIVMMGTSSLAEAVEGGELEGARAQIRLLERSVDRGSRLSRQLVAFARRQVGPPAVVDLHAHLRPAEVFLRSLVGAEVALGFHLGPDAPRVRLLPGQVEQLVINLVSHAAAGMSAGGWIRVESECVELDGDGDLPAGEYIALRVRDDAAAIPAEARDRLFEPFFDLEGRGTGMSMATCYGIAVQAGGAIRATLDEAGRNVVEVLLPRTREALTADAFRVPPRTAPQRPARVLLAEDEAVLRAQLAELLITAGHEVVAVEDGQAALEALDAATQPFDLVVTDVLMPRASGVDVARAVQGRLPVILLSGFVADAGSAVNELAARHVVLTKPVRPDLLLRVVQEALPDEG